jgi:murein DD-endopeptidase MepM/ murein hydrolase activator NlpD
MKKSFLLITVLLIALATGGFYYFSDTRGPQVVLTPESGSVSPGRSLQLTATDPGSGLRSLTVQAIQKERTVVLIDEAPAVASPPQEINFTLEKAGLSDGPFELRITAVDRSIYHFGSGNTTSTTIPMEYDSAPPEVTVLSTAHNLSQGGAGLILYTLSEEVEESGIKLGDLFFPGYRQPDGFYACLFAFPHDLKTEDFKPRLVAVDRAGNRGLGPFYYRANPRDFAQTPIVLDQLFLETKAPEFKLSFPETDNPLELFLRVNRELRTANRAALLDYGRQTAVTPLWLGPFLRQSGASTRGLFGERRSYLHNKTVVDKQVHLGIDLASVAHAPVQAANSGTVVFAGSLGIYGKCVILDHGLGLQSLYGHLSQIGVKEGDGVKKGDLLGRSGMSGMAGGDHLHFGMIISGVPVNPLEWWDGSWLKNNVNDKWLAAGKAL